MKALFASAAVLILALAAAPAQASIGWSKCHGSFAEGYYAVGPSDGVAICRADALAISYDPVMIGPAYSAYFLNHTKENHLLPGRDSFYEDPDLEALNITQANHNSDAFNSSWNRGHLAPSHALSWTADTKKATYTMANIAPQAAYFNQQPWNHLETNTIDWTTTNKRDVFVMTGVGYKDRQHPRRSFDNIAVPDYYWKVICDLNSKKSVGYAGDNVDGKPDIIGPMSVRDVQDKYYGLKTEGASKRVPLHDNTDLLPEACKIDDVDYDYWKGIKPDSVELEKILNVKKN